MKNDFEKVQTDLREIEDDLLDHNFVMEKLTELEDRSRRINVRIDGIPGTSNQSKPRTVVCNCFYVSDTSTRFWKMGKKLKYTGIFIYEDFSKAAMELRKSLWEEVLRHQQQNKIAYLNYRSNLVKDRIVR